MRCPLAPRANSGRAMASPLGRWPIPDGVSTSRRRRRAGAPNDGAARGSRSRRVHARPAKEPGVAGTLRATRLDVEDEVAANELYQRNGWTDGLPVVAPTEERVAEAL